MASLLVSMKEALLRVMYQFCTKGRRSTRQIPPRWYGQLCERGAASSWLEPSSSADCKAHILPRKSWLSISEASYKGSRQYPFYHILSCSSIASPDVLGATWIRALEAIFRPI